MRQIAEQLGFSLRTIRRRMSQLAISVKGRYSRIPDRELEQIINTLITENNNIGYRQIVVRLRTMGHIVRRQTVLRIIRYLFGARNQQMRIVRREYRVRAPLSVTHIHIDGNHKLSKK